MLGGLRSWAPIIDAMGQMGRLAVWLNVMIVTDFLVKCGLEMAHPPGSSRHPGTWVRWLPSVAIWLVGTEAAFSSQVFHHLALLRTSAQRPS